jgi:hypothetical protein
MWRVGALALSFVSGWRAFSSVSLCKHRYCIGLVATGTFFGSDALVKTDARSRAAADASLVTSLTSLPLPTQDKFLLLCSSLQARLTRTKPWHRLPPHITAAERQVLLATLLLVDHHPPEDSKQTLSWLNSPFPCASEASASTSPRTWRLMLPSWPLPASTAEIALLSASAPFQPFHLGSPICTSLTCQWATLHNAAPGHWSGPARELEGTRLDPILADPQRLYGRHLAEQRFASLLASAPASFEGSKLNFP